MSISVSDQALEGRDNGLEVSGVFPSAQWCGVPFSFGNCWDSIGARLGISVKMIYYLVLVAQSVENNNQSINFTDTYSKMLLVIRYFTVWKRR